MATQHLSRHTKHLSSSRVSSPCLLLFLISITCSFFCTITSGGELTRKVLEVDYVDAHGICKEWMYDLSRRQMCNPALPHVESLVGNIAFAKDPRKGPTCVPHNNNRIESLGKSLPAGADAYVPGCCVQACKVVSNVVGYLVSGMKEIDKRGNVVGGFLKDPRCPTQWGVADYRTLTDTIGVNRAICKRRESHSLRPSGPEGCFKTSSVV